MTGYPMKFTAFEFIDANGDFGVVKCPSFMPVVTNYFLVNVGRGMDREETEEPSINVMFRNKRLQRTFKLVGPLQLPHFL